MAKKAASATQEKAWTKKEVESFLSELSNKIVESEGAYLHSVIALNQILALPNAEKLFDASLKKQAKEIWIKIRAMGFELADPPLLFGQPKVEEIKEEGIEGGDEIVAPIPKAEIPETDEQPVAN